MKTEKNPKGRPSLYKPEYCEQLIEYFNIPAYERLEVTDNTGQVKEIKAIPNVFPTLARFACNIGVTRETLHDWATSTNEDKSLRYPNFSYAYKKAKEYQEANLVEGAIAGAYAQAFAIFTAKNVLGWKDKTEQELTGANGGPLRVVAMNDLDADA
jgi:DNA-packaging protein gp3